VLASRSPATARDRAARFADRRPPPHWPFAARDGLSDASAAVSPAFPVAPRVPASSEPGLSRSTVANAGSTNATWSTVTNAGRTNATSCWCSTTAPNRALNQLYLVLSIPPPPPPPLSHLQVLARRRGTHAAATVRGCLGAGPSSSLAGAAATAAAATGAKPLVEGWSASAGGADLAPAGPYPAADDDLNCPEGDGGRAAGALRRDAPLPGVSGVSGTTRPRWNDIDADARDSPYLVGRYVGAIFENLKRAEGTRAPDPNYLARQPDVTPQMRAILVDWLVEVAEEYRLNSETLYLSVNYIDRFLSRQFVPKAQIQLVGVTCLLLASKYEEIYAPQVDEFCYITDNTYTRTDVLAMEQTVLRRLEFQLTAPTGKTFLRRFLRAAQADTLLDYLAGFLCELALTEYEVLAFPPSQTAAASVLLALHTLERRWTPTLEHFTGYRASDLEQPVRLLHAAAERVRRPDALPAVRDKYATPRFKCVSKLMMPRDLPDALFSDDLV